MFVCPCVCFYMSLWRPEVIWCLPVITVYLGLFVCFDIVSHWAWISWFGLDWLASEPLESVCFCLFSITVMGTYYHHNWIFLYDCWRYELSSSNLIEQETLFLLNHFLLLILLSNFECRCVSIKLFHVISENVLAISFLKKIVFMVYGS